MVPTSSLENLTVLSLDMDRIEAIHQKLPNTPLGHACSSSVPQELQDIITNSVARSSKHGGVLSKRFNEESRVVSAKSMSIPTAARDHRCYPQGTVESPDKFDPRDYLKPARTAMKQVCVARMTQFGQAGNASKLRAKLAKA